MRYLANLREALPHGTVTAVTAVSAGTAVARQVADAPPKVELAAAPPKVGFAAAVWE